MFDFTLYFQETNGNHELFTNMNVSAMNMRRAFMNVFNSFQSLINIKRKCRLPNLQSSKNNYRYLKIVSYSVRPFCSLFVIHTNYRLLIKIMYRLLKNYTISRIFNIFYCFFFFFAYYIREISILSVYVYDFYTYINYLTGERVVSAIL